MKYLLVLILTLCGCSNKPNSSHYVEEARTFCRCHGGLDTFVYNSFSYFLSCKDGLGFNGTGNITEQHFVAECDK